MYATRISALLLALLCFATLAGSDALSPRFISDEAVFTPVGDIPDVALQPQASGLAFPTSAVNAGDDRLFLTLRDGRIVIFSGGAVLPNPFLDIRSLVDTDGEGGLLSAAFHPRFAQNGFVFVNYTDRASFDTIVARYQVSAGNPNQADPGSARVLLRIDQPFSNHNGGQIQFGPDGYLYIGMGDGGAANDPDCRAQRGDTLLGKMLRIDVDQSVNSAPFYGIPADNPFRSGNDGIPDEIWASGFRNPWRFSFDRSTGDLYVGDVGQGQREEIDRQPASSNGGENYGWKVMEGTLCFSTASCPGTTPPCNSSALTLPILEYQNAGDNCSVIGGYVYRGTAVPQLAGHYVFGDLCSGQIWAARMNGSAWQVWRAAEVAQNLIAFGEDRRGELYVATSSALYRFASTAGPEEPEGADSVGLFDPATMTFRIKPTLDSGSEVSFRFGKRGKGWLPVAGDWNGDGHDTVGLWDRRSLSFHLKNSLSGGGDDARPSIRKVKSTWLPLAGDWNGDGRDGIGFYDPDTGTFRFKQDPTTGRLMGLTVRILEWQSGMIPLAGDWDGDGRDSAGLFDPDTNTFRLRNALSSGSADVVYDFGDAATLLPLVGDWDGDGVDTPGFYNVGSAEFSLTGKSGTVTETVFQLGEPGRTQAPLAGSW